MQHKDYIQRTPTLFSLVINEIMTDKPKLYQEMRWNNTIFIVNVTDPYGFIYPNKDSLKLLSRKQYSKLCYSCEKADNFMKDVFYNNAHLCNKIEYSINILESIDAHYDILSGWCKVIYDIHELKCILNMYQRGPNCSWDIGLITEKPQPVVYISLWRLYK